MKEMKKIVVGLVGTSQLSFPGPKEKAFARCADGMAKLADKMGFDLVVYKDTVITREDAITATKYMEENKVDFLMVQHTSYTGGQVAPVFAKIKNARVGFWAIPEGVDCGAVPFNSFCSINMHCGIVAHYLRDYNIPIKWFYGDVEDPAFVRRFEVTVRAIRAIVNISQARIALVGGIAPYFNDLYDDERNINKRFEGIFFYRLHEFNEIKERALAYSKEEIEPVVKEMIAKSKGAIDDPEIQKTFECDLSQFVLDRVETNARIYKAYKDFVEENDYDAVAISCWPKFADELDKFTVCATIGQLNDEGTVAACEGDVLSAISMLILKYIAGGEPTMLMDMSAFDQKDNSVLLWHCGPAASHFCQCNGYHLGCNFSGTAHVPNCGVTSASAPARDMVFDPNDATIFRLSGEVDKYMEFSGHFMGDIKPSCHGSRGWLTDLTTKGNEVKALDLVNTVLSTGFQHHFPVVLGHYYEEVEEFCAWLGLKRIDMVPYADYLQR